MYKNSPAQRAKGYPEELGPGEWYLALYTGLSYLPSADWKFASNFPPPYQLLLDSPWGVRLSMREGRPKISTINQVCWEE